MPSNSWTAPGLQRYELLIRPAHSGQAWQATLVGEGGQHRIDFETPEALARHLRRQATPLPARQGLR